MPAPIGYTETLPNLLPTPVSSTGSVVLIGFQQPTTDGGTDYQVATVSMWWGMEDQKTEHTIELRIGDTFHLEDETWRLDSIELGKGGDKPGSNRATITRVA